MNKEQYSAEELETFRILIEKKCNEKKKVLDEIQRTLRITNDRIAEEKVKRDNSAVVEEQEQLNLLSIRLQKLIQHLEAALVRIKNKTYGICRKTGKRINKRRLLLVPHATLSIEAKEARITRDENPNNIEDKLPRGD